MRAVRISLDAKGSNALSSVRLSAAVDLYQGDCVAAAAKLEEALRLSAPDAALLNDASVAHLCVARDTAEIAGPSLVLAVERWRWRPGQALKAFEEMTGRASR